MVRVKSVEERKKFWAIVNSKGMMQGGRSVCTCGHLGDGDDSQHQGVTVHYNETQFGAGGHGPCTVEGCDCQKFRWNGWKPEIIEATKGI